MAHVATDCMDRGGHGGGALRGHDHEQDRGPSLRSGKSANEQTRAGDWRPLRVVRVGVHDCRGRIVFRGGLATESAGIGTGSSDAGDSFLLLLHETLYELVASVSWIRAGNFAGSRMDRRHRRARLAHTDSLRRGHAV